MRRRRKSLVPTEHKKARLTWAAWVLKQSSRMLSRWIYTDGTVFYLARCASELTQKRRLALGPMVWRQANGRDGLYEDCVGASSYAKAQGTPVRIWGLLDNGILFVHVLLDGEKMNRWNYEWLIYNKFPGWIYKAFGSQCSTYLVQDHEKALWCQEPADAMEEQRITRLDFPKCSQDCNPIEICWRELRARLYTTEPTKMETRKEFIIRLRSAVEWVNKNRIGYLWWLSTCQREWALELQAEKGIRLKH